MNWFSILRYKYAYTVKQSSVKLIGFVLLAAVARAGFQKEYVPGKEKID